MPRGRSSSSSSRGSSSRSSSRSQSPPRQQQPMQQQTQQPMQQSGGGMMSGIGSTIMTGMAFGAGSEVAHQAVRSVMGGGSHHSQPEQVNQQQPEQVQQQSNTQQNSCLDYNTKFVDCLKRENNDISSCQSLFDDLKSCEKGLFR